MGSPQKNVNPLLESPYAKHLQQYPSQSEGYAPSEFGGKMWAPPNTPSQHSPQENNYQPSTSQRRRGNNRYFNANRNTGGYDHSTGGRGGGRGGGGGGGYRNNYHHNYQNNYNQQTNRSGNSGNRSQPYHPQNHYRQDNTRDDFFHPSMLEDPWKDLLNRHNAIKNSRISEPSTETTASASDNQCSSDEDDNVPNSNPNTTESASATPTTTSSSNL